MHTSQRALKLQKPPGCGERMACLGPGEGRVCVCERMRVLAVLSSSWLFWTGQGGTKVAQMESGGKMGVRASPAASGWLVHRFRSDQVDVEALPFCKLGFSLEC